MSDPALFHAMARNNAWANHRLLSACAGLSQAEIEAQRTGFFPSLRATLNHILVVDWFYVDALEGGSLGRDAFTDEEPCRTVADLKREQAGVDARLIALCAGLTTEGLAAPTRLQRASGVKIERSDRVLLHLFQHQIHHRGQAHTMLAETAVAPPQLDEFFLVQDEELRAAEFAALGWQESDIWS